MGYTFREWISCPACEEREAVSTLAHRTEMVIECYNCGQTSEYVIGKDISLQGLDVEAIIEVANEQTSGSSSGFKIDYQITADNTLPRDCRTQDSTPHPQTSDSRHTACIPPRHQWNWTRGTRV